MFYVFLVLIILGSFSFYFYKMIIANKMKSKDITSLSTSAFFDLSNPVELAYLNFGQKHSFGVALYSLIAYKFAKRNTAGILRFINLEEKNVPTDPYTRNLVKIISIKMRSAVIYQLARNEKLQTLFNKMIEPAVDRMEVDGLIYTRKEQEDLRFVKFLGVVVVFLAGFYALLFSSSFWGMLLVLFILIGSVVLMNVLNKTEHITPKGEKFSNECFSKIGKEKYNKGIYALAKYGESRFKEKNLEAFLGKKEIDWEEYY